MSIDVDAWRGVAQEQDSERTAAEAPDAKATIRLRASSRALLRSLLRPHRRALGVLVVLLLLQNAAAMAGPWLVRLGIDHGIPPVARDNDYSLLVAIAVAFGVATLGEYATKRGF